MPCDISGEEMQEKRLESERISETGKVEDEFPDGGLRAWLVVFGVRPTLGSSFLSC